MTDRNKAVMMDYATIATYDDTQLLYYQLSKRQASILLSQTEYIAWMTRWYNLPQSIDLRGIKDLIDYQLMNPAEIEMFDCNDVEECLTTSPIILAIQAAINSNDNDIATLQGDVINAQNTANNALSLANTNAGDIVTIQNQIATESNRIDVNEADIINLQSQVSQNIADITALQNASGGNGDGLMELITSEILTTDGTFQEINVEGYRYVEIRIVGGGAVGVSNTYARVFMNADTTLANYEGNLVDNTPNFAFFNNSVAASAGAFTAVKAVFFNTCDEIHNPVLIAESGRETQEGQQPVLYPAQVSRKNEEAVTTLKIQLVSGDFIAGSNLWAWGIKCSDSPAFPLAGTITVDYEQPTSEWDDWSVNTADGTTIDADGGEALGAAAFNDDGGGSQDVLIATTINLPSAKNITGVAIRANIEHVLANTVDRYYYVTDGVTNQSYIVEGQQTIENGVWVDLSLVCDFDSDFLVVGVVGRSTAGQQLQQGEMKVLVDTIVVTYDPIA